MGKKKNPENKTKHKIKNQQPQKNPKPRKQKNRVLMQ